MCKGAVCVTLSGGIEFLLRLLLGQTKCSRFPSVCACKQKPHQISSLSVHVNSPFCVPVLLCGTAITPDSPSGPSPADSSNWAASWETTVIPEDWGSWLTSPFGVPSGMITSPCFWDEKRHVTSDWLHSSRGCADVTSSTKPTPPQPLNKQSN